MQNEESDSRKKYTIEPALRKQFADEPIISYICIYNLTNLFELSDMHHNISKLKEREKFCGIFFMSETSENIHKYTNNFSGSFQSRDKCGAYLRTQKDQLHYCKYTHMYEISGSSAKQNLKVFP